MRMKNVLPEPVLSSNMDRKKEYRDRKTHERRTLEKVKEHERQHPVHKPYVRQKSKDWIKMAQYDVNDEQLEF